MSLDDVVHRPLRPWRHAVLLALALFSPGTFCEPPQDRPPATSGGAAQQPNVHQQLLHATAYIEGRDKRGNVWSGTGWLLDEKRRLLVTNDHVVNTTSPGSNLGELDRVSAWFPVFDNDEVIHEFQHYVEHVKPIPVTVIYTDAQRDLALVQIPSQPGYAAALKLAEKSPPAGERLHSLAGLPRGSQGLFIYTQGTSRAVYKRSLATGGQVKVLETQMPLNRGNSGGAIVNDEGKVVAVFEGLNVEPGVQLVNMCIDLSEIRTFLDKALPLVEPETAQQFNERGDNHYEAARYDQALADYDQALKVDRNYAVAVANRGWVFYRRGDLTTALAEFQDALSRDSELVNAYSGRGVVRRDLGDRKAALEDQTQAIRRDPNNAVLYNERGITYHQDGQYEEAVADFARAAEKNPKLAWAYANRGDSLIQLGRHDDAIRELDKAISIEQNAQFFNLVGNALYSQQKYEPSLNAYSAAIQRDAKTAMYYRNRAGSYRQLTRLQDAAKDLLAAIELEPKNDDLFNELGIVFFEARQHELAVQQFAAAIALDSTNATYFRNRADSSRNLSQFDAAIADLAKAIELDPQDAELFAMRGACYSDQGDSDAALADYRKAVALEPKSYRHCRTKFLVIHNDTSKMLTVQLLYYTSSSDGQWHWFPARPEQGKSVYYTFKPGESAQISHDSFKIHASRVRVWAESDDGTVWHRDKDRDVVLVPAEGYLSKSGTLEKYEYRFHE
jgi:tetratricopeptide (TPR) repeat protein